MAVLERIISIIMPVFIIVGAGYLYARLRGDSARADMTTMNRVSMEVFCPLLVFTALSGRDFDLTSNAVLILAGFLISLGSGLLAWPMARMLGYDTRSFVPPMMYNNCGNMGLPLALFAFGAAGLPAMIALFMACNLVFFSVGITILESGRGNRKGSPLAFLASPMMLSMIAGIGFSLSGLAVPAPLFGAMKMMGDASIPLMLFALGIRMLDVSFRCWKIGLQGAAFCPLAGLAVARLLDVFLTLTAQQRGLMYLFAALPPAVFCFIMAEHYQQEPDRVAAIVLLGNLASLLFVPLGLWMGMQT
ncbi:MAG: AEC family transporter [Desulfuromonadales bacterium]|nr:AEC family transporter [Desulfuromonadales bacterium]